MAHLFDSGMFVRKPAWHNLGNVIGDWPGSFEEARKQAGLTWEVETKEIFDEESNVIPGWQRIIRNDTGANLSIEKNSYAVIGNSEFGNLIDYVLGGRIDGTSNLKYETLISLDGGRQIIATMYLDEPIHVKNDPSETYPYLVFISRHDGQGGLKLGPTAVRVVCANTQAIAERQMDSNKTSFTIRHTSNWATKTEEARDHIQASLDAFKHWERMAQEFASQNATDYMLEDFMDQWLPYSTDMKQRVRENVTERRAQLRKLYEGPTCAGISGTKWGILQAAIEMCDHTNRAQTTETRISRTLARLESPKREAHRILAKL